MIVRVLPSSRSASRPPKIGGELLGGDARMVDCLDDALKRRESGDLLDVRREQQRLGHVEDQQRLHPIIREPFERLCRGEERQRLGMAQEGAVVVFRDRCHRILRNSRQLRHKN